MPKLKAVEKRIWDVEDFAVRFLHADGRDVRGMCYCKEERTLMFRFII